MKAEKTACRLLWNYPVLNFTTNQIRLCCRTPGKDISNDLIDNLGTNVILNTDDLKQRRLDMLQGIKHPDCNVCWTLEDTGAQSQRLGLEDFRNFIKEKYDIETDEKANELIENADINSPLLESKDPYMLEVSLGNLCDLKCVYCNQDYSSQWAAELIRFGELDKDEYESKAKGSSKELEDIFWKWFYQVGRHSLDRIGIIGGEPLINDRFYPFIDRIIEAYKDLEESGQKKKKVHMWIVTNLNAPETYMKKFEEKLDYLSDYFFVEVHASMESLNEKSEFIRNGVKWDRFNSNVERLLSVKRKNFEFGFQMAINSLSVTSMTDFLKYAYSLHKKFDSSITLKQNVVGYPSWLSPMILPAQYAKHLDQAADFVESVQDEMPPITDDFGTWKRYSAFLREVSISMKSNNEKKKVEFTNFYSNIQKLSSRRKLKFHEIFPEMKPFLLFCKVVSISQSHD
tara:strand:+ start:272 stop:1642 length:1371 start_codon:yes stop_codon:yes gene_type:complete